MDRGSIASRVKTQQPWQAGYRELFAALIEGCGGGSVLPASASLWPATVVGASVARLSRRSYPSRIAPPQRHGYNDAQDPAYRARTAVSTFHLAPKPPDYGRVCVARPASGMHDLSDAPAVHKLRLHTPIRAERQGFHILELRQRRRNTDTSQALADAGEDDGSLSRTRTCDKSINSRLLYQLSYQGMHCGVSRIASLLPLAKPRFRPDDIRCNGEPIADFAGKRLRSQEDLCYSRAPPVDHGASEASWRSGYAEDCKSLHPGSIPGEASITNPALCLTWAKGPDATKTATPTSKPRRWILSRIVCSTAHTRVAPPDGFRRP